MIIGSFGNIVFKVTPEVVHTFRNLKRTVKGRYSDHDIIGKKPVVEFLGPGLCEVSFEMYLLASLGVNPRDTLLKMYDLVHEGSAHSLYFGVHRFGKYHLESYEERWEKLTPQGNLVYLIVSANLKESD